VREEIRTVPQVLEEAARRWGGEAAMRVKRDGVWHTTTWSDYRQQVRQVARALLSLGVEPRDGVAILGANRPEWFLSNLGAIAASALPAGIYTTSTAEQCRYIAHHAEAAVAVVENPVHLATFLEIRGQLPHLEAVVVMEDDGTSTGEDGVWSWPRFLELGDRVPEADLDRRLAEQSPDDPCTLIYTSGTTGPPKAVMLCHRNLVWVTARVVGAFDVVPSDAILSYLPLSHVAEQVVSLHAPLHTGACSWFAESLEKLGENLREVRPHFFFGVPRVWEKMQAAMQAAGAQSSPLRRRLVAWARGIGLAAGYADQRGEPRPRLYGLAHRLVFSKVRQRLGFDRARVLATSAAPITRDTLEFFLSLGMPILEVYGMSECCGPTTLSTLRSYRTGAVGRPIEGTGLELAEDGEILMRGPHVFLGYYKNEEATREAVDEDGWLHSGDIGVLDEDGFLRVTDRKKDLLITSGGKNVAPQVLEAKLKQIPVVSQAVVVGDRRHYVAALVTLDPDRVAGEAEACGSPARDAAAAAGCPTFRKYLEKKIEEINAGLARYESIRRFAVLPRELSIEGGELTPTLKIKRKAVYEHFAAEIAGLYA